jgi:hypothetical protein
MPQLGARLLCTCIRGQRLFLRRTMGWARHGARGKVGVGSERARERSRPKSVIAAHLNVNGRRCVASRVDRQTLLIGLRCDLCEVSQGTGDVVMGYVRFPAFPMDDPDRWLGPTKHLRGVQCVSHRYKFLTSGMRSWSRKSKTAFIPTSRMCLRSGTSRYVVAPPRACLLLFTSSTSSRSGQKPHHGRHADFERGIATTGYIYIFEP